MRIRLRIGRATLRLALLYVVICLIWGTTWYAMKSTVATLPPMTAAGLRFTLAFPFLAVAVWRSPTGSFRLPRGVGWLLPFVTISYIVIPYTLINVGDQHMDSGLAAILFSSVTIFLLIFSRILSGTHISARQWFGVTAGLVCLTLLILDSVGGLAADSVLAPVAVIGAALLHALTYAVLGRFSKGVSVLALEALPVGIGGVVLLLLGVATEHPDFGRVSAASWWAVIYLAVIASVVGFAVYFYLVQRLDPVLLSFVFIFFPVVAVAISVAASHARLTIPTVLLAAITLVCFALAKQPRSARRADPTGRLLVPEVLAEVARHAVAEFPRECCGFILDSGVRRAVNAADWYHANAPGSFTRTAETGYVLDAGDALFLEQSEETDNPVRVLYHSHPNGRAYFSDEDLRRVLFHGQPVYPRLMHLVVGIDDRGPREARLYKIRDARPVEVMTFNLTDQLSLAARQDGAAAAATP